MATVTKKECDVFKTQNNVARYKISLTKLGDGEELSSSALDEEFDLCDRALARLKKFIKRGTTPPSEKADGEKTE